ncbi:MAG: class I SAM-dependent methyltransferase [Patescibacteria group bacterium]|nr:MAG: class I SAM-dependent methyltransferase [Patescibacteria group bacterium]
MDPSLPYWDDVAPRWDALLGDSNAFMNYQESFRRFHWFLKRALKIGNRTKSYRLLDLACGTGEASWPLWKRVASVTFLDRSPSMLRAARNKYPKGIFVRGDAASLPFLDAEFDVVVSRGAVLSQLDTDRIEAACAHVWRILRPQGYFFFDFVTDPKLVQAPEGVYRTGWRRKEAEAMLLHSLPGATILAYDGTEAHAFNRILVRKP